MSPPSASPATVTADATSAAGPKTSALPAKLVPFLVGLGFVAGFAELGYAIVNMSVLPIYLKSGLGLPTLIGFAITAFAGSEAIFNSPMGSLADRVGRRRLMVGGATISIFTCLIATFIRISAHRYANAEVTSEVLFLRVLDGLGAAALWPAVFAAIGDRVDHEHQSTAMGVLNITYLLGIAFGPLIGGYVNQKYGMRFDAHSPMRYGPSFFAAAGCFAGAAVVSLFVAPGAKEVRERIEAHREKGDVPAADNAHSAPISFQAVQSAIKRIPAMMVLVLVTFIAIGLIAPNVKVFAMERYNLNELQFGKLFPIPAIIVAALALPMGRLGDIWGKPRAIQVGMTVCAVALWFVLVLKAEWSLVVLGSILGVGFVLAFPAYMALLSELTGPEERGGIIGAVRMAQGFGLMLGAAPSALIAEKVGHMSPFVGAAALLSVSALLSFLYIRKDMKITPEQPTQQLLPEN